MPDERQIWESDFALVPVPPKAPAELPDQNSLYTSISRDYIFFLA